MGDTFGAWWSDMRGRVEVAEKSSDGCNLPGESVIGRVAGRWFWVDIIRREAFQMGYTFGNKKMLQMGDTFGDRNGSKWVAHLVYAQI